MRDNIKMKNIRDLIPAEAIHPGLTLQDELEASGFTQRSLASEIGVQPSLLNEIIKGKRNISADLALSLEAALGIDASFWLELQMNYELDLARIKESKEKKAERIAEWQQLKQFIPYKYFISQGLLNGDPTFDIDLVKKIYKASSLDEIKNKVESYEPAYFRKSNKLKIDKINLNGWIYAAKYIADSLKVSDFTNLARESLVTELRKALFINLNLIDSITNILSNYGIKFFILKKPDKTPVDGFCFWSGSNPTIVLTLRHKDLDKFGFNLFHELAHVFEHLIKHEGKDFLDLDIEEDSQEINEIEDEANTIGCNMLVPPNAWEEFISSTKRMDDKYIISFSNKLEINPAILVGMRCHSFGKYVWQSSISREIH